MSGQVKNLLFALVSIAAILISGFMFVKPNLDDKKVLETEVAALEQRYNDLMEKEANRPVYEAGIKQNLQLCEDIVAKFPADIQQENYVKLLGDMQKDKTLDFTISNASFSDKEIFYVTGQNMAAQTTETVQADATTQAATSTEAATTQAATGTEAVSNSATATASADEMTGYKANLSINYDGKYKGIKNLLAYVMTNKDRMTIDQMSMTYSKEEKQLSGTFSFNLYAIAAEGRVLAEPEIDGVETGVDNIFDKNDKSSTNVDKNLSNNLEDGEKILEDYDHFIALEPSTSDADAITVGAKNDNSTYIASNENTVQNVTVKYFMVGDKYMVSYNIGDKSFPENFDQGTEFDPGEELSLAILSSKRKNDKDKSGIKLVIDNETDKKLNVKIDGEDPSNPRVKIASRIGKVKVYE